MHPAVELFPQHVVETALFEQVRAGNIRLVEVQLHFLIGTVWVQTSQTALGGHIRR